MTDFSYGRDKSHTVPLTVQWRVENALVGGKSRRVEKSEEGGKRCGGWYKLWRVKHSVDSGKGRGVW